MKIVINYSLHVIPNPYDPQIKIFLMKSKSFLTLHRQQHNYHIQGPEMQ